MASSAIIAVRSTLGNPASFPQANLHLVDIDGRLVDRDSLGFIQRCSHKNSALYSVSTTAQPIVFDQTIIVNNTKVTVRLTMLAAPNTKNISKFLVSFFQPKTQVINTGFVMNKLKNVVNTIVRENCSIIKLDKVPVGGEIKNAARHFALADYGSEFGLNILHDTLAVIHKEPVYTSFGPAPRRFGPAA